MSRSFEGAGSPSRARLLARALVLAFLAAAPLGAEGPGGLPWGSSPAALREALGPRPVFERAEGLGRLLLGYEEGFEGQALRYLFRFDAGGRLDERRIEAQAVPSASLSRLVAALKRKVSAEFGEPYFAREDGKSSDGREHAFWQDGETLVELSWSRAETREGSPPASAAG